MTDPRLSGERLIVTYRLRGNQRHAREVAHAICVEQTIEYPEELVTRESIRREIVGRVLDLTAAGDACHRARIAFASEVAGRDFTQLLNVVFGNISLLPGIRVLDLDLPPSLCDGIRGPRYGSDGLRERLGAPRRPLLATALKPLGLAAEELARTAHSLALGGIDIIKDDHGLTDQPFCRFDDRVRRCADAVRDANAKTGRSCLYAANVTAPADAIEDRARWAKECGAGALLIAPGLVGLDRMRALADDDSIALPLLSHPAFQGSFLTGHDAGIDHGLLLGTLNRLAGADAAIFPHCGGRFAFSVAQCRRILDAAAAPLRSIRPLLPAPAGGMQLDRVDELVSFYGHEVILLIGGALHRGEDLVETCRRLRARVDDLDSTHPASALDTPP